MNTGFYREQNFNGTEIGINLKTVKNSNIIPIYIPSLIPYVSGGSPVNSKQGAPNASTILNANGRNGVSACTTSNYVDLAVPLDTYRAYFYDEDKKEYKIPKGTQFIIAFPGGEINKPRIIGVY